MQSEQQKLFHDAVFCSVSLVRENMQLVRLRQTVKKHLSSKEMCCKVTVKKMNRMSKTSQLFEIYLTQEALDSPDLYSVVIQTARYVERMEYLKIRLPDELHKFLSLEVYFGRSRNAGHSAFCHENYEFPLFAEVTAKAARAIRAEEYALVIDDLKSLMSSSIAREAGDTLFDIERHEEIGLRNLLNGLDERSYGIRLTSKEILDRIDDYSDWVKSWVASRLQNRNDDVWNDDAYYALASAWLLNFGNVVVQTKEEREFMFELPDRPIPQLKKKGWIARLFRH